MANISVSVKNEYKQKNSLIRVVDQTRFETDSDLKSLASYITNRRFDNPNVFTEPCKECEGYGIVNEKIVVDDIGQYLVGDICKRCNGLGRFNFIEAIKNSKKLKNDI